MKASSSPKSSNLIFGDFNESINVVCAYRYFGKQISFFQIISPASCRSCACVLTCNKDRVRRRVLALHAPPFDLGVGGWWRKKKRPGTKITKKKMIINPA